MTGTGPSSRPTRAAKKTAEKKVRVTRTRYDWDAIRTTFVEQVEQISLKELSDQFGVPYNYMREKSSTERWAYLRAEHQSEVSRKQTMERIKKLTQQATSFDDQSLSAAKMGQTLIQGRLAQIGQVFSAQKPHFDDAVERLRRGQAVDRHELYSPINYKEINELAAALDRFQTVGRRALGTDTQHFEHQVHGTVEHTVDGEVDLNVSSELQKYDGDRLAAVLDLAARLGTQLDQIVDEEDKTFDGEVVEDDSDEEQPAIES